MTGISADLDYGGGSASDTSLYAIEDTRRALLEDRQQGIVPFCIAVDRFARDYIPRLYGNHKFAIPSDVTPLLDRLLRLTA